MDYPRLERTLRRDEGDHKFEMRNGVKKFYMYPDSDKPSKAVPTIGIGHNMRSKMTPLAYTELYKAFTGEDPPRIPTEPEALPDGLLPKSNSDVVYDPPIEISEEAAMELFEYDIKIAEGDAQRFLLSSGAWDKLGCDRQEVLVNMAFNLGFTRLNKFNKFRAAILEGVYSLDPDAADKAFKRAGEEMKDSNWWGQVKGRSKRLRDGWDANDASKFDPTPYLSDN